jgi:hypothetical protein
MGYPTTKSPNMKHIVFPWDGGWLTVSGGAVLLEADPLRFWSHGLRERTVEYGWRGGTVGGFRNANQACGLGERRHFIFKMRLA